MYYLGGNTSLLIQMDGQIGEGQVQVDGWVAGGGTDSDGLCRPQSN